MRLARRLLAGGAFSPSLRRNFVLALVGQAAVAAATGGTLFILARATPPEVVGTFALGLAVTSPFQRFTSTGIRAVVASDARNDHSFGEYLGYGLSASLVALALLTAVGLWGGFGDEKPLVIVSLGVVACLAGVRAVFYGALQRAERFDLIALSQAGRAVLSILAVGLAVMVTHNVLVACAALAATASLTLFLVDVPASLVVLRRSPRGPLDGDHPLRKPSLRPAWRPRTLLRVGALALPLGLVALLESLNGNVPRYFVQYFLGDAAIGAFAAVAFPVLGAYSLFQGMGHALLPRLALHHARGEREMFRRLLFRFAGLAVALAIVGVVVSATIGGKVLALVYTPGYAGYGGLLTWLFVAAIFGYAAWVLEVGITGARRFGVQPLILAAGCMVGAMTAPFLVPRFGLVGAAWTLGTAFLTLLVLRALVVARILRGDVEREGLEALSV